MHSRISIMLDGSTTGGYPKIATLVGPDLLRLAQAGHAERIRFRSVEWELGHEFARALAACRIGPLADAGSS